MKKISLMLFMLFFTLTTFLNCSQTSSQIKKENDSLELKKATSQSEDSQKRNENSRLPASLSSQESSNLWGQKVTPQESDFLNDIENSPSPKY